MAQPCKQRCSHLIQIADLEKPLALDRRFDLVLCLEVAEHLPPTAAEILIDSLTRHADHILFSAAVPSQGGTHHVNEQLLTYWVELFAKRGFLLVDLVRGRIWENTSTLWWLRQNCVLFVQRDILHQNPRLLAEHEVKRPINIISPDLYGIRIGELQEEIRRAKSFIDVLIDQKQPFNLSRMPDGRIGLRFAP